MQKTSYTHIIGTFLFKDNKIISQKLFNNLEDMKKHKDADTFGKVEKLTSAEIIFPKITEQHDKFYQLNVEQTEHDLKNSVNKNNLITQTISNIDEINKTINLLCKRLREWYGLYFPELNENIKDNEVYAKLVVEKSKEQLSKEFNVKSIGSDVPKKDVEQMQLLAKEIINIARLRENEKNYFDAIMVDYCPNLKEVATSTIAGELIAHTGSLEKLAEMPSSTIQLLGAEKALFRHMVNKRSNCPKHGIIINHPLLANARQKEAGKIARHLAGAIAMACKVDYFHKGTKLDNSIGKKLMIKINKQIKNDKN